MYRMYCTSISLGHESHNGVHAFEGNSGSNTYRVKTGMQVYNNLQI